MDSLFYIVILCIEAVRLNIYERISYMAIFFNQATLSYNDNVTNSNIVTGQLLEVLTADKTAVIPVYEQGGGVTYVISIRNSGASSFTALTVTDDLGAYSQGGQTLIPLDYVEGSVRYFVNGVLQPAPATDTGAALVISGINIPAGGNAIIVYETEANRFAPPDIEGTVTNTAVITGGGLATPVTVSETVAAQASPDLSISKAISPDTVVENDTLTYTFVIQNYGNAPAEVDDNAVVSDTFDPILSPINVTFNGEVWEEGVNYTYNSTTGEFATVAGQITVPAATFTRNEETGAWTVTPGVSVLRVSGTV